MVEATGTVLPAASGTADAGYTAHLRFASGAEAVVDECAVARGPAVGVSRVVGEAGSVWLDGGTARLSRSEGVEELEARSTAAGDASPPAIGGSRGFAHLELGPWTALAGELRAAVVDGVPPALAATFDDGVAVMEVLDRVRAAG